MWCNDPNKNPPLSTIMGSASSAIKAVKRTIDHGLNTFSPAAGSKQAASTGTEFKLETSPILSRLLLTIAPTASSDWKAFKRWLIAMLTSLDPFNLARRACERWFSAKMTSLNIMNEGTAVGSLVFCILLMGLLTERQLWQPALDLSFVLTVLFYAALGIYHSSTSLIITCCCILRWAMVEPRSNFAKATFSVALIAAPAVGALLSHANFSEIDISMVKKGLGLMIGIHFFISGKAEAYR